MSVAERSSRRQVQVALVALLVLAGTGCGKNAQVQVQDTPQRFQMPDTAGMSAAQQAILLEAASEYDTFGERPPVAIDLPNFRGPHTPGNAEAAPNMTIATMRLKSGHTQPSHRLIARIKSEGDYPPFGIYAGMNFIWRNSWSNADTATWVTKIVPTKPSAPEHVLQRDSVEYTHGAPAEPRLVKMTVASFAIAACLDDPRCGSGHCGLW
jgi:hypothetical protein